MQRLVSLIQLEDLQPEPCQVLPFLVLQRLRRSYRRITTRDFLTVFRGQALRTTGEICRWMQFKSQEQRTG